MAKLRKVTGQARKRKGRVREWAPVKMTLREMRESRGCTQIDVAERMGLVQGEISKIEHRDDIRAGRLAEYVRAVGGRLELRVVFKDREVLITGMG